MSRINTNIASIRGVRQLGVNQADLDLRLERLSSGLRINRGRDDPAGLIISEKLRGEIRATQQAVENSQRSINVISTAEGALNEVSGLLLKLQDLIVSTSNEAGLSLEEVRANQLEIDAILDSVDRIGNTTTFADQKLLDGSRGYSLSSVPINALASVNVFAAELPNRVPRDVRVRVTQSAQTAQLSFVGTSVSGTSVTSATTVDIRGQLGSQLLSFSSGSTLAEIRTAINNITAITGLSAVVSSPSVGMAASAITIHSTQVGSDAFVAVSPLNGNFVAQGNLGTTARVSGVDAGVIVDGQRGSVRGLRVDVRGGGFDARIDLTKSFGQTLSSATFTITSGGNIFQLTPEISTNGQINVGLMRVASTTLGDGIVGSLFTLRSGQANDLDGKNFSNAQTIAESAIEQVAALRGRLGSIQRHHLDSSIRSQSIAIENLTASESVIRDAEIAEEISALTRAQILVQSTQSTLQVANSIPNLVLSLLS